MLKVEGNSLFTDNKKIDMQHVIRTVLEYKEMYVVLFGGNSLFANNVIAIDSNGTELWKINDILKIEEPSGNTVIRKKSEEILVVLSSIGIMYEINIKQKKVLNSSIMR